MNLAAIVAEWRRGCSNTAQHYRAGAPASPNPEACPECTAAAMRAVARWLDVDIERRRMQVLDKYNSQAILRAKFQVAGVMQSSAETAYDALLAQGMLPAFARQAVLDAWIRWCSEPSSP